MASVVLGVRAVRQLYDNLAAAAFRLWEDEMTALTTVSAPGLPTYPNAMLEEYTCLIAHKELGVARTPLQ